MACGDWVATPTPRNLLSQSARFLLAPEDATAIIDDMERTVKNRWYEVARREGVSEQDCAKLAGAFAYEGFRLPLGVMHRPR